MSEQQTLNLETASLEDIRKAEAEEIAKQPRDDKGRFVAAEPEPVEEQEPESIVYVTTIDLEDGSGVQRFEANSQEELTEKLAEAQRNATRKIRAQEAELKELRAKTTPKVEPKVLNDDEKYVFKQEFEKDPYGTLDKIFKQRTGMSMEELQRVKQGLDRQEQAEQVNNALATFLATHEDFEDSPKNSAAMKLALQNQQVNGESLHKAYLQLKQSGLLELKGSEANADTEPKPAATERIAQSRVEVTQTRTRRSSGISSQARPIVTPAEPSEAEAYNMPLEKLRELANRQLQAR